MRACLFDIKCLPVCRVSFAFQSVGNMRSHASVHSPKVSEIARGVYDSLAGTFSPDLRKDAFLQVWKYTLQGISMKNSVSLEIERAADFFAYIHSSGGLTVQQNQSPESRVIANLQRQGSFADTIHHTCDISFEPRTFEKSQLDRCTGWDKIFPLSGKAIARKRAEL